MRKNLHLFIYRRRGVGSGYTLANILEDDRTRAKQPEKPRSHGRWTQGELLIRAIDGLKQ